MGKVILTASQFTWYLVLNEAPDLTKNDDNDTAVFSGSIFINTWLIIPTAGKQIIDGIIINN